VRRDPTATVRTRAIALSLAAAVASGHVVALVHQQRHAHVTCEHGEIVHAEVEAKAAPASDPAVKPADAADADHEHGCAILLYSRSQSRSVDDAASPVVPPAPAALFRPSPAPHRPRSFTIRLAPARSPPA
jgi:hypothetical protein